MSHGIRELRYPDTERLTKREQIAAMAMQAMIGTATEPALTGLGGAEAWVAAAAFRMADAMLAESSIRSVEG